MTLTGGQLQALRTLSRKRAGLDVGWMVIADARELTELGLAARNRSGWQLTALGEAQLAEHERSTEPAPVSAGVTRLKRGCEADEDAARRPPP